MDLLPLGVTCALSLAAWCAVLLREPWLAASLEDEEMLECWFLH